MLNLAEQFKQFQEQQAVLDPIGMNSRVLLVDATNSYIRCFSAIPTMNENGEHIGGVVGFLKSITSYVRQSKPSRVILVFDGAGGSQRRRKAYSNYKSNRHPMQRLNRTYGFNSISEEKNSMAEQMLVLIDLLHYLPLTMVSVDNIEADDAIAYLNAQIIDEGGSTTIMSTDKDFLQLVTESCSVWNPVKKTLYTPEKVHEEYGIHPNNFLLYRIIDGDVSDNIDGVKGISKKTLVKMVPEMEQSDMINMDFIVERCKEIDTKTSKKICEAKEHGLLERNEELMNLRRHDIAGTTKMNLLEKLETLPNKYDPNKLTRELMQFRLHTAFGDLHSWMTAWNSLSRYSQS